MNTDRNQLALSGSAGEVALPQGAQRLDATAIEPTPARAAPLPSLDDFPIPFDARPDHTWTPQMLEMADFVGAYATLVVVDAFAGQEVYIGLDASRSPFREILDRETCEIFAETYAPIRFRMPTARAAVNRAKRAPIIAAVRAGVLSSSAAAKIIGTNKSYMSHLVNHSDEGVGMAPAEMPMPREAVLMRCAAAIVGAVFLRAGVAGPIPQAIEDHFQRLAAKSSAELRAALQTPDFLLLSLNGGLHA